jgi:hypothetical protein
LRSQVVLLQAEVRDLRAAADDSITGDSDAALAGGVAVLQQEKEQLQARVRCSFSCRSGCDARAPYQLGLAGTFLVLAGRFQGIGQLEA